MRTQSYLLATSLLSLWAIVTSCAPAVGQRKSASRSTVQADGSHYDLRVGSATVQGKVEARVRWTVLNGWLPAGGFNLYRTDGAKRAKLNSSPVGSAVNGRLAGKTVGISSRQILRLGDLFAKSNTLPPGVNQTDLIVVGSHHPRPASSAPVFAAHQDVIKSVRAQANSPSSQTLQEAIEHNPVIAGYLQKFGGQPVGVADNSKLTPSQRAAAEIARARSRLLLGSMLHPQIADLVGLAFDDRNVQVGSTYTYALRTIDAAGHESATDVAEYDITVGSDPQPPAPTGLLFCQRDADSIAFRWDRLPPASEESFGIVAYNLYRAGQGNAAAVRVNDKPILIADSPAAGGHVDPERYYTDSDVGPGPYIYRLTMIDAFGRESPPAVVAVEMEDWHTPDRPEVAQAERIGDNVMVTWSASPQPGVLYRIYRLDLESYQKQKKLNFELLTAKPITGSPLVLSAKMARIRRTVEAHQAAVAKRANSIAKPPVSTAPKKDAYQTFVEYKPGAVLPAVKQPNQSAVSKPVFLGYVDPNVPKDHYYAYYVTACYVKNKLDSGATVTSSVPVPLDIGPAAPANLTFSFARLVEGQKARKRVASLVGAKVQSAIKDNGKAEGPKGKPADTTSQIGIKRKPARPPHVMPLITMVDRGGTITLKWDSVAGKSPITYRIYRTNATGYFPSIKPNSGANKGSNPVSVTGQAQATLGSPFHRQMKDVVVSGGAIKQFATIVDPTLVLPLSEYDLLAEVSGTSYSFPEAKSLAHYYRYKVVAVNRWGIPGKAADIKARVPSTFPPTTPLLISATPNDQGGIDLSLSPNPNHEEVTEYRILRKKVPFVYTLMKAAPTDAASGVQQSQDKSGGSILSLAAAANAGHRIGQAKFGGRSLISVGPIAERVGAGASRMGVARHQSSVTAFARLLNGQKGTIASPELQSLTSGFLDIGAADPKSLTAAGHVTFTDTTTEALGEYLYRAIAVKKEPDYGYEIRSVASSIVDASAFKVAADAPKGLVATFKDAAIVLTWQPSKDADGRYVVERKMANGPPVELRGPFPNFVGTSYTDFSAIPGVQYTYVVRAVDKSGNLSSPATIDVLAKSK